MDRPATIQPEDPQPLVLSKKAQKRAAKAARLQEQKSERRAREREAKKRKRRERVQAGNVDPRKRLKTDGQGQTPFAAQVVIDLGFDDMMTDKEVTSLTSQLAYTYSANRRSLTPFTSLLFTSLNGRTKERLDAINDAGYKRWTNTQWWEEGYDRIWESSPDLHGGDESEARRTNVVYLTADSEEELIELKEGEIYVIGGICDHNRYKDLCLNKAKTSSIRHARLPIGRYIASLTTRKVLTVNQVFEILLKWVETRDWEQAFWSVIPKRKFQGKAAGLNIATPDLGEHVEEEEGQEEVPSEGSEEDCNQPQPVSCTASMP